MHERISPENKAKQTVSVRSASCMMERPSLCMQRDDTTVYSCAGTTAFAVRSPRFLGGNVSPQREYRIWS